MNRVDEAVDCRDWGTAQDPGFTWHPLVSARRCGKENVCESLLYFAAVLLYFVSNLLKKGFSAGGYHFSEFLSFATVGALSQVTPHCGTIWCDLVPSMTCCSVPGLFIPPSSHNQKPRQPGGKRLPKRVSWDILHTVWLGCVVAGVGEWSTQVSSHKSAGPNIVV